MFKSLRLRLMVWQLLLLALVVAGFGTAVYLQTRQNIFSEMDAELLGAARVIEGTIRAYVFSDGERDANAQNEFRRPPHRHGRPDRSVEGPALHAEDIPAHKLQLPREMMDRRRAPGSREDHRPYFAVFDQQGQPIQYSPYIDPQSPTRPRREYDFRLVGRHREVVLKGPGRTTIIVGSDAHRQNHQLRGLILVLAATGTSVLLIGSLGAWWLTGRAIGPIKKLSETADSITATNLKDRIDVDGLDTEFRDVSHTINSMVDRLATAIEQQRQFTADASHELRTPIAILNMHSELALSQQRSESQYRNALETCLRAGERMHKLTEDLLTLARSDSDQMMLELVRRDLLSIVNESVAFFDVFSRNKNVKINVEGDHVMCIGDANRIRQLIDNLVKNAIVHNEDGGWVSIAVLKSGEHAIVRIANPGPAIPAIDLPRLFDRFYTVEFSRHRQNDSSGGSGLGLAICKSIADAHHATLTVSSDATHGTVFEFSIPAS
jgi:two-component system, OmpR family, sensor kinase